MSLMMRLPAFSTTHLSSSCRRFAGHSKWHNIRQRKGAQDARRAKAFVKLSEDIASAARACGGDTDNARLAKAIGAAKHKNMPKANIDSAVARGTSKKGAIGEWVRYEGYGPANVMMLVEALTDNRNRTGGQIRHLFAKYGGSLQAEGAVSWAFQRVGQIELRRSQLEGSSVEDDIVGAVAARGAWEQAVFEGAIEAGAEDVEVVEEDEEEVVRVLCGSSELSAVAAALEAIGFPPAAADLAWIPKEGEAEIVSVPEGDAEEAFAALLEGFDDNADVQAVHHNAR